MITIGRLAEKFHMLPHNVEQDATTYDFMITDVLATYDNFQQAKNKGGTLDPKVYNLTTDQLLAMKNKVKK